LSVAVGDDMIVMVPFAFVCQGLQVQPGNPRLAGDGKDASPQQSDAKAGRRDRGYVGDLRGAWCRVFLSAEGRLAQERRSEPALEGAVASTAEIADIRASRNGAYSLPQSLFSFFSHFKAFSRATVGSAMVEAISLVVADWLG